IQEIYQRLSLRERSVLAEGSVLKIGESLDAEHVVYGSFEFTPSGPGPHGSLKISARIVDRRRMHLGPEFVETGALEDLATLEAHLAWRSLTLLAPKLAPPENEFRTLRS